MKDMDLVIGNFQLCEDGVLVVDGEVSGGGGVALVSVEGRVEAGKDLGAVGSLAFQRHGDVHLDVVLLVPAGGYVHLHRRWRQ